MIQITKFVFILMLTLFVGARSFAAIQCAELFSAEKQSPENKKSIDDTITALAELKLSLDQAQARGAMTVQGIILAKDYVAKENEFATYLQKENIMTHAELIAQIKAKIIKEQARKKRENKKEEAQRQDQEMIMYKVFDGREAKFHEIRPGSFNFGPKGQQTPFTFKKPFAMMATMVTQTIWEQVATTANQLRNNNAIKTKPFTSVGELKPAVSVTHAEVMEWIEALNFLAKMRSPLIYELFPEHQDGDLYRLPKEVEWEFVARSRGLRNQKYNFGSVSKILEYAWVDYRGNHRGHRLQEVAQKRPILVDRNPFFDLYGNAQEYVLDGYIHQLPIPAETLENPTPRDFMTLRGGSTKKEAHEVTSYSREGFYKKNALNTVGFRLVRERNQ